MSDSSRIFVRGLPPNYTDDEFRSHFGKRFHLTDARLFPHRRIGYIGFKSIQDAEKAVKYFNKSFIRMSRIHVEFARGITHAPTSKLTSRQSSRSGPETNTETIEVNSRKRKRNAPTDQSTNLKETASLNGLSVDLGSLRNDVKTADIIPENSDLLLERESTKSDAHQSNTETRRLIGTKANEADEDQALDGSNRNADVLDASNPDIAAEAESRNGADDSAWMRSRTSRLLGLIEEDSDAEEQTHPLATHDFEGSEDEKSQKSVKEPQASRTDLSPIIEKAAVTKDVAPLNEDGGLDRDENGVENMHSSRLFIRNLPFTVEEDDLRRTLEEAGKIVELHFPRNKYDGSNKGIAFVTFEENEQARLAMENFDGKIFQGRLLHILPAAAKREENFDDYTLSQLPLKKQRLIQKKAEAGSSTFNWNSMYMNPDAVVSSVAERLGLSKSELLDPSSSSAGVKQAQAETFVIQETKDYLRRNGVNLDSFGNRDRNSNALLVKNFPYGTTAEELRDLFMEAGEVSRLLMPPSGTLAIVQFAQEEQARHAFKAMAYRKFKDTVLFLERAPKNLFTSSIEVDANTESGQQETNAVDEIVENNTVYVRNINFATTNERFRKLFEPLEGFVSARVKTKPDPKKPGHVLSMGFGFLEFKTKQQAQAAVQAMNGHKLDDHYIILKPSQKGHDLAEERQKLDKSKRSKDKSSKVIIKNVPFEASRDDLRNLLKVYGQLRTVRLPKKFDNSRKGFGFAEFTTPKEAENAIDALRNTHLLGRRLILEYASGEIEDPEKEIEEMQRKIGRQSNNVTLQQLTKSERRKFTMDDQNE